MNTLALTREVSLDYAVQGRQLGIPVLLLHGYTDSRRSFDRVMPRMPASICAFAISQRGHGESDRPDEGYSPHDFASDIAAFMDRFNLPASVIVGHSMGATVAQRFAIEYPERTCRLVLISSFPRTRNHPGMLDLWESTVSKLEDPIDPTIARDFQLSTVAEPVPVGFLNTMIGESLKAPARVWKAALRGLMEADFAHELENIRVPTLLVWGDQDGHVSRSDQDRLLAAIPQSKLSVYRGVGHAPHWEDPARCAKEIADFAMQF
jgi:pimeloyl-ACP methyl ester carboxylesterase